MRASTSGNPGKEHTWPFTTSVLRRAQYSPIARQMWDGFNVATQPLNVVCSFAFLGQVCIHEAASAGAMGRVLSSWPHTLQDVYHGIPDVCSM